MHKSHHEQKKKIFGLCVCFSAIQLITLFMWPQVLTHEYKHMRIISKVAISWSIFAPPFRTSVCFRFFWKKKQQWLDMIVHVWAARHARREKEPHDIKRRKVRIMLHIHFNSLWIKLDCLELHLPETGQDSAADNEQNKKRGGEGGGEMDGETKAF